MMDKFRTIYITQPIHDFAALANYCQNIRFLLPGNEDDLQTVLSICKEALADFDAQRDALVIVGKSNFSFLTGIAVHTLISSFPSSSIRLGVYLLTPSGSKDYRWDEVNIK